MSNDKKAPEQPSQPTKPPAHDSNKGRELLIDPLQLSARLTLYEALLEVMYRNALFSLPGDEQKAFVDEFVAGLRFKMQFKNDDGEEMFELQRQTVALAERFFAKAMVPAAARS